MTLAGSGSISISDINEEIGNSSGNQLSFGDDVARWLAEDDTGALSISSFRGKTSVKVVATASEAASGNSHTFSGVNFGNAFSGRRLIACIGLYASGSVTLNQISCTIGGTSTSGDDSGENLGSGPSCGAGIWAGAVTTGTSGSVVVNWSGGAATRAGLILLSASGGFSTTAHDDVDGANGGGSGGSATGTQSLNIPSNGLLIVAVAHANTNGTTILGVTERQEIGFSSARLSVGFDNRKGSQSNDTVSASWSGSTAYGMEARSYSQ